MKKVVWDFCTPLEITEAKRDSLHTKKIQPNSTFAIDRCNLVLGSAHEADLNDVIAALDCLDNAGALDVTFAAVAADGTPKYSSEQLNIFSVVDRQLGPAAILQGLLISGDAVDSAVYVVSVAKESISKVKHLSTKLDMIAGYLERRLDQLSNVCGLFVVCFICYNTCSSCCWTRSS